MYGKWKLWLCIWKYYFVLSNFYGDMRFVTFTITFMRNRYITTPSSKKKSKYRLRTSGFITGLLLGGNKK